MTDSGDRTPEAVLFYKEVLGGARYANTPIFVLIGV